MFTNLRNDIATVLMRDPAARSSLEVLLCYPGVHALALHRIAHHFWGAQFFTLARVVSHISRVFTGIEIHPGATIGRGVFIDHGFGVVIGETAIIGDECTIYQGVTLGGTSLTKGAKRHPTLERGVIVAAGAKVLGGFTVGEGARVGSNSVLLRAVPPGATAVGMPAKIIEPKAVKPTQGDVQARQEQSFSAYGLTANADDPTSMAIHKLAEHIESQNQVIEQLRQEINRLAGAAKHAEVIQACEPVDKSGLAKLID
jgi:serine O-acetyltransferase